MKFAFKVLRDQVKHNFFFSMIYLFVDYENECIAQSMANLFELFCGLGKSRLVQEMVLPWSGRSMLSMITGNVSNSSL